MPKLKDQRYLDAKDKFLEYSFQALQSHFGTKDEFLSFFEKIKNDAQKNLFLKTASFYLFLVKKGDWLVDISDSNRNVDYLTDTYKYIAIFSLIESLQDKSHLDFYSFLARRKTNVTFPIRDKTQLEKWYRKYKKEFGSIRQSVRFFKSLSTRSKAELINNLEVTDVKATIENLSKYLYALRSQFVHEAELVVNMSGRTTISTHGKKTVICKLSLANLMKYFEEGLIRYFSQLKITGNN
ncbi:MAG: hypothetical protein ACXACA_07460 [Candidatus Ranarchaeia archaeon]